MKSNIAQAKAEIDAEQKQQKKEAAGKEQAAGQPQLRWFGLTIRL